MEVRLPAQKEASKLPFNVVHLLEVGRSTLGSVSSRGWRRGIAKENGESAVQQPLVESGVEIDGSFQTAVAVCKARPYPSLGESKQTFHFNSPPNQHHTRACLCSSIYQPNVTPTEHKTTSILSTDGESSLVCPSIRRYPPLTGSSRRPVSKGAAPFPNISEELASFGIEVTGPAEPPSACHRAEHLSRAASLHRDGRTSREVAYKVCATHS